jgi:hypothetical protein
MVWGNDKRGLGSAIAGIIVVAVLIGSYILVPRAKDRVYAEILAAITTVEEFAEDDELLTEMADRAHAAALWTVHDIRDSSWWSPQIEEMYVDAFFEEIVREAHYHDRKDLQGPLRKLQRDLRRRKGYERDR